MIVFVAGTVANWPDELEWFFGVVLCVNSNEPPTFVYDILRVPVDGPSTLFARSLAHEVIARVRSDEGDGTYDGTYMLPLCDMVIP